MRVTRHVATQSKIAYDAIERETMRLFKDMVTNDERQLPHDELLKIRRKRQAKWRELKHETISNYTKWFLKKILRRILDLCPDLCDDEGNMSLDSRDSWEKPKFFEDAIDQADSEEERMEKENDDGMAILDQDRILVQDQDT